ncbi:MAG: PIN domain-containing protein [Trueperaceae bacterium]
MTTVLDASAVLALLGDEPGAERVAAAIVGGAAIGAVNLTEVLTKLSDIGMPRAAAEDALEGLGLEVVAFDADAARAAAALREPTRARGLSLGDRAAMALAAARGAQVLTADRAWVDAVPEIEVVLVR